MPEFLKLTPVQDALQILLSQMNVQVTSEKVATLNSLGRVTTRPINSPLPLPPFPRATVDGYAVRAADTFGASESLPAYLRVIGEILMGASPFFDINAGEAGLIHTGGMLPESCNAVVMVEYTQAVRSETVECLRSGAVGVNIIAVERMKTGQEVIPLGAYSPG
jgi:molybdopterin molybdotransferase